MSAVTIFPEHPRPECHNTIGAFDDLLQSTFVNLSPGHVPLHTLPVVKKSRGNYRIGALPFDRTRCKHRLPKWDSSAVPHTISPLDKHTLPLSHRNAILHMRRGLVFKDVNSLHVLPVH